MYVENDNLIAPEIGSWGLDKYKLLGGYCDIFATGMRYKWSHLTYIDLFSGAGFAKLKNENKFLRTSTLIASAIPKSFSKYIACEFDEEKLNALKARVDRLHPEINIEYVLGDSNKNIEKVIDLIPKMSGNLNFCFVDPFSLNLEFNTIKQLSMVGKVDFLILLALQMDANRNFHNYVQEESDKIDRFLGDSDWRKPFLAGELPQNKFIKYLADRYDNNMKKLGYVVDETSRKFEVRNDSKLPIYYLAFYSKNARGNEFYSKIEKYQHKQGKLF